jgi:hypothetical protein
MTRRALRLTALWALALTNACAVTGAQSYTAPSAVVTMSPARYADVRVISGYLRFDSHSRQLWDDASALRANEISKCVTLINTMAFEPALRNLDSSFVEIEGFPVEDVLSGRIDVGACNRVGFYVRSVRALTGGSSESSGNSMR